jgi:hypothetical protein
VSRMADKTYAAQSAIVASYLLSVSGSSLLCTLVPSMPTLLFSEPFSRALYRMAVGGFAFKDSGGYEDLRSNEAAEGCRRQKKGLSRGRLGSSLRNQVLSPSSCLRAKVGSVKESKWAPTHQAG